MLGCCVKLLTAFGWPLVSILAVEEWQGLGTSSAIMSGSVWSATCSA